MKKIIQFNRLAERAHHLIRTRATGPPEEFARRLDMSRSTMYNFLEVMRELGAPIEYDSSRGCYYYRHQVQFQMGFFPPRIEPIKPEDNDLQ